MTKPVELPQGTLEMLILKAVSLGCLHGYGILLRIQQISGKRQLKTETAKWTDMAAVVAGILGKKAV